MQIDPEQTQDAKKHTSPEEWRWRTRGGSAYFLVQGVAVSCWWLLLVWVPPARALFHTRRMSDQALLDFAWPDVPLVAVGSFLCAWALWRAPRAPWTQRLVWLLLGATAYPSLYVTGATFASGGEGWAATLAMLFALSGTFLAAWTVRPDGPLFRVAPERSTTYHIAHTMLQTSGFWLVTLCLGPWLFTHAERTLGIPPFDAPFQSWLPWVLFGIVGCINLYTGYTMSRWGQGTPLPLETARVLVVRGPYRYVRNPMAVTGLFLGLMVGWWLGSWLTMATVVLGGLAWNFFVRPIEERDLLQRFGEPYREYTKEVKCWIPRWPSSPQS